MEPALRDEILRRYAARIHCFDQYAASRRRRGLTLAEPPPDRVQRAVRPADGVTPAELRVLHLIAEGLTDRQIAELDDLSESTVKASVRSLFRKLDAKNRPHAVATAVTRSLLTLEVVAGRQN